MTSHSAMELIQRKSSQFLTLTSTSSTLSYAARSLTCAQIEAEKTVKYKAPFPYHFDGQFEKSFMLRFLIHMAGDSHQPLHVTTRCTPSMPECDAGGNKFPVGGSAKELHALWDQAMGKIPFEPRVFTRYITNSQPLTQASINKYQGFAAEITKKFTRAVLKDDLAITDHWAQAKKTFEIAVNYAYKGIKEKETPSPEYLAKGYEQCQRQIALAGYRLADFLKTAIQESDPLTTTNADDKTE